MRIIAGEARGRRIDAPTGRNTRPTLDRVRENLFNILQNRLIGRTVLDLFAGSGALSLEAISRGAAFAVMVDSSREAHRVQMRNTEGLGFSDRAEILLCDWHQAVSRLKSEGRTFDLVFLDPPYSMTDLQEVFRAIHPLLSADGLVILEHEAGVQPMTGDTLRKTDERKWGFCAVTFFTEA